MARSPERRAPGPAGAVRAAAWYGGWEDVRAEDIDRITRMLREGRLSVVSGGVLRQFETRFARFAGTRHAVAFNNGTAAIYAALWALGVRAGDEVPICDHGFHGMAAAVLALGARVVPVDCLEDSYTIDPNDLARARSARSKVVLVHNPWGVPADFAALRERAPGLPLVADASHAHGARYRGRPLAAWADVACYSLGHGKLVSGGELGCAATDDAALRDRMLALGHVNRVPGDLRTGVWDGNAVGLKLRPHALALALAHAQLGRFDEKRAALLATGARLERAFAEAGFLPQVVPEGGERVYWRHVLRLDEAVFASAVREEVEAALAAGGLPVEPPHYRPPLQGQAIFRWTDHRGRLRPRPCPAAARIAERSVTLPAPVHLPEAVVDAAASAARRAAARWRAGP